MSRADPEREQALLHVTIPSRGPAALAHRLALIDIEGEHRRAWYRSHFDPNQPRVPRGHSDGGQWTRQERSSEIRLASADGFRKLLPKRIRGALELIDAYRKDKLLKDLFDERIGAVSWTRMDGKDIYGANSGASPFIYTSQDRKEAEAVRDLLIRKYPEVMATENLGHRPNDALFHAEVNVLLRAARESGGTLSGRSLEVISDRRMCPSCLVVLPKVGLELGNPTVTFIDHNGKTVTMRDGKWLP